MNDLKSRLRNLREQKKLTRKELGGLIQASHDQIYNWETGRGEPDSKELGKLAAFYSCTTDYLLGRVASPTDELVCETTEPLDPTIETIGDPASDEINDLLSQMTPEEKEAFRRLAQSVVNRQTKGVS